MDAEKKKGGKEKKKKKRIEESKQRRPRDDVALENKLINTRRAIIPPRIVSRPYLPPGCDYKRASVYYSRLCSSVFHAASSRGATLCCFRQYSSLEFDSSLVSRFLAAG